MTNVYQLIPKTCPRCSAPTERTGGTHGCTLCTWPNPSWVRVLATLARKGVDAQGYDMTDEGLEDFAASLQSATVLTDSQGRKVTAKVVEVHVHDGQVDVTFEFDPEGWQVPV